jgi:hypothetical protein
MYFHPGLELDFREVSGGLYEKLNPLTIECREIYNSIADIVKEAKIPEPKHPHIKEGFIMFTSSGKPFHGLAKERYNELQQSSSTKQKLAPFTKLKSPRHYQYTWIPALRMP